MVGFGSKAIDLDRNGWLDLLVTNGHVFDRSSAGELFRMPPQLLMNQGKGFQLVTPKDSSDYWSEIWLGRSMALLDFDRDQAMDVLIGHLDRPVALLQNQTQTAGQSLQLELIGTKSEREATGASVVVTTTGQRFKGWSTAGDGYYCTDESVLDLGLGESAGKVDVQVHWPSGETQDFVGLLPNRRYLLVEGQSAAFAR